MADANQRTLLAAVRALRTAQPTLGVKPMVAKLRGEFPWADSKAVREAANTTKSAPASVAALRTALSSGDDQLVN
jgi:hypothetical protein